MTESAATTVVVVPPMPALRNSARLEMFGQTTLIKDVRLVGTDDLIARADAHIIIDEDGIATISDKISEALSPVELEHVKLLVSLHNVRPAELRASAADRNAVLTRQTKPQALGEACVANASARTFWWGFRIYMDHCLCNDIAFIIGAGTAVTTTIFGILAATEVVSAVGAGWVGLAVGIIVTMAAWIAWADSYCGSAGCNYNQSWTVQGWITTVC